MSLPPPIKPRTSVPIAYARDGGRSTVGSAGTPLGTGSVCAPSSHASRPGHGTVLASLPRRLSSAPVPARRGGSSSSQDSGIAVASTSNASGEFQQPAEPSPAPVNYSCADVPRPDLGEWSALACAERTMFDAHHRRELRKTLSQAQLDSRWDDVELAAQALDVKMFAAVYYYLTGSCREAMRGVLDELDCDRAACLYVAGTLPANTKARKQEIDCVVAAAAGFMRLVSRGPCGADIDEYVREFNAAVPTRELLSVRTLEQMFCVHNFRKLEHVRGQDDDFDKIFSTRGEYQGAKFRPRYLSNGKLATQNQMPIVFQETFADRRIDKLTAPEWFVLLVLLQERLTRLGNADALRIAEGERPVAAHLLRKVLVGLQDACAGSSGDATPSEIFGAVLDEVLARHMAGIRTELRDRLKIDVEPLPDQTIAMGREYRREWELAERWKAWLALCEWMKTSNVIWDTAGTWLHSLLASDGFQVMQPTDAALVRLELSRRLAKVFDAFLEQFQDEDVAAEKGLRRDRIPVQHWNAVARTCQPHYYSTPALAYHFMRKACGVRIDAALSEIWDAMRSATGLHGAVHDAAFARAMFDRSFEEFRKNAALADMDALCGQIAINLLHLDSLSPLPWRLFSMRVRGMLNANEACRKYFAAQFDEDLYAMEEAEKAVEEGVPGASMDRADLLRPGPASEGDPTHSGNFSTGTEWPPAHSLGELHRGLQSDLLQVPESPPGPDGQSAREESFKAAVWRGKTMDAIRAKAAQHHWV